MRHHLLWLISLVGLCVFCRVPCPGQIDLSGIWRFEIDTSDCGIVQKWYLRSLKQSVHLPGSMAENEKGLAVTVTTPWYGGIVDRSWFTDERFATYREPGNVKVPFWLTPNLVYYGAAWYQRDVIVPDAWANRRIFLFLERCHWESSVWVDSVSIGSITSLAVPHEYDVSSWMKPGHHTITIRVDNRINQVDVGRNAHSITDHTQTNWNGIIGKLELRARSQVLVEDLTVYPDVAGGAFRLSARLRNHTGRSQGGTLSFSIRSESASTEVDPRSFRCELTLPADTVSVAGTVDLGEGARLWNEFNPTLYRATAHWEGHDSSLSDEVTVLTGLREFRAAGTQFTVNGQPTFLRGTLDWVLFPQTGYPSMAQGEWEHLFSVMRRHGLNHVRFHSWCPPEAAFAAADRAGLYLQVECGLWTRIGDGEPVDRWLYEESERIVKAYGNHPSFCMLAHGNEPGGENAATFLSGFVSYWKNRDPRRVYTSGAGWPTIPESDFVSIMEPRIQLWGAGLASVINAKAPATTFDFRAIVGKETRPVVAHETGQWCAYPDFREIPDYRGILRAGNYEMFRADLESNGLGTLAGAFLQASGKLQSLCYKADIEAALRTPGMAGFQLLGLHDFPGQGTAPVGVLNVFSKEKGYISADEFRRFCAPTVPLARMEKLTYLDSERLFARLEVAHFGEEPLTGAPCRWSVADAFGTTLFSGSADTAAIAWGTAIPLGQLEIDLGTLSAPGRYRLTLAIAGGENSWDFWVYPAVLPPPDSAVHVTTHLDEKAERILQSGGKVLLTLPKGSVRPEKGGEIAMGFSTIFWNTAWTSGQAPHTLGILCDPDHPAFARFPTEGHSDYQWWDAITHAQPMMLDGLPIREPLIRVIDDWFTNRSLGLAVEAWVGAGRILLCTIDLTTEAAQRPEARQLLHSLTSYMQGTLFTPHERLTLDDIRDLLCD